MFWGLTIFGSECVDLFAAFSCICWYLFLNQKITHGCSCFGHFPFGLLQCIGQSLKTSQKLHLMYKVAVLGVIAYLSISMLHLFFMSCTGSKSASGHNSFNTGNSQLMTIQIMTVLNKWLGWPLEFQLSQHLCGHMIMNWALGIRLALMTSCSAP